MENCPPCSLLAHPWQPQSSPATGRGHPSSLVPPCPGSLQPHGRTRPQPPSRRVLLPGALPAAAARAGAFVFHRGPLISAGSSRRAPPCQQPAPATHRSVDAACKCNLLPAAFNYSPAVPALQDPPPAAHPRLSPLGQGDVPLSPRCDVPWVLPSMRSYPALDFPQPFCTPLSSLPPRHPAGATAAPSAIPSLGFLVLCPVLHFASLGCPGLSPVPTALRPQGRSLCHAVPPCVTCPRSTWVPLGDYIASNTDECTATLMYAVNLKQSGTVSFEYIYPDSSIVFEFFVGAGRRAGLPGSQGVSPSRRRPCPRRCRTTSASPRWRSRAGCGPRRRAGSSTA